MSIQLTNPMESHIERNGDTIHHPHNSLGEPLLDENHLQEQDRWLFAGVGSYTEIDLTELAEDDGAALDDKSHRTSVNGDGDGDTDGVNTQIPVPPSESESDGGCCSWFTSTFGSDHEKTEKGKEKKHDEHHEKLGEWPATSICANDITSSCFYVAGICSQRAGIWAPISLLLVSLVLFLFRGIYGEVVTALPLNGGAYNALLNTTTKNMAAIAACLTMLSYTATAVVSAQSAADYLNQITDKVPTSAAVVGLLGLFAFLNLIGISESSKFALLIFLVHMVSLSILVVACLVHVSKDGFSLLADNWHKNFPTSSYDNASIPYQIFFGFCTAFLGISGFETSANFVEEQKPGVFVKTLRNMWMIVSFFNPVLCFLAFGIFEYNPEIKGFNQQQTSAILAKMGDKAAGTWLNYLIGIDASLVLSGAVLTSYVGIGGLIRRMALDRCLPMILVQQNSWRNTAHFVIIGFFLVCTSLYFILNGNTDDLAGVYTVAFMSVMSLFAVGNIMLKYKRGRLPRQVKSTWFQVIVALVAVLVGLVGNIVLTPTILQYFAIYFGVTLVVVWTMFLRISLLKVLYFFVKDSRFSILQGLKAFVERQMKEINQTRMVFFTKEINNLGVLNKAILYVRENEQTNSLIFVHCFSPSSTAPGVNPLLELRKNIELLDRCYPKLKIDLICVRGRFNPRTVERLSEILSVPPNFMFIACPGNHFPIQISELHGVRLITH